MGETIGEAWINIMPSTQNFESGLSSALSGLSGAAKTCGVAVGAAITAGVATVSGLTSAVSELASAGDEISKESQKLGVSTDFYQEWSAVLEHSGTSMDAMGTSFKKLATISQSATDEQVEAFSRLGLSMEEVSSMSAEDLFASVISGLQGMEEGNDRTALAIQLLGKNAQELGPLLNTSAEDTQAMIDTVHDLGGVLSDTALNDAVTFQDNLQDLQTAMGGLKNSMIAELLPGFNEIMAGLTAFVSGNDEGLTQIQEGITGLMDNINSMIPELLSVASSIVMGLASSIIENLPAFMETGLQILTALGQYIIENLPMLITTALELLVQFANYLTENLPTLIPTIVEVMLTIVETLLDNIDMLIDAAIELILALADGLITAMPKLIEKVPTIIEKLVSALVRNAPKLLLAAESLLMSLGQGLVQNVTLVIEKIPDIIEAIKEGFLDGVDKIKTVGSDMIEGLWNGIADKSDWIISKIKGFSDEVLQGIKDFFSIASPSKVMRDEVGKWIPIGMAVGIEANADSVTKAMDDIASQTLNAGATIPTDIAKTYDFSGTAANDSQVMDLLRTYLPMIANNDVRVEVNADSDRIFDVVRKKDKQFKKQTGVSAFA